MDQLLRKQNLVFDVDPTIRATFFNLMNHLSPFLKKEFKYSPTVDLFSSGRTKAATIVNCIDDRFFEELKSDMQEYSFSIMVDPSNDTDIQKMFPMTV